jgi:ElaB/YqjD/DUF883 family membrane-anchored ribosome-binding protein
MADKTLEQLAADIDRLPDAITTALEETAHGYAERLRDRAEAILLQKTHRTGRTARAIASSTRRSASGEASPPVEEDPANADGGIRQRACHSPHATGG